MGGGSGRGITGARKGVLLGPWGVPTVKGPEHGRPPSLAPRPCPPFPLITPPKKLTTCTSPSSSSAQEMAREERPWATRRGSNTPGTASPSCRQGQRRSSATAPAAAALAAQASASRRAMPPRSSAVISAWRSRRNSVPTRSASFSWPSAQQHRKERSASPRSDSRASPTPSPSASPSAPARLPSVSRAHWAHMIMDSSQSPTAQHSATRASAKAWAWAGGACGAVGGMDSWL